MYWKTLFLIFWIATAALSLSLEDLYPFSPTTSEGKELEEEDLLDVPLVLGNVKVNTYQVLKKQTELHT